MYGSDWYMPMAVDPRAKYLNTFRSVFLTEELNKYYKDFFCRNAIRFLKLDENRIQTNSLLTAEGKAHLKDLIKRAKD